MAGVQGSASLTFGAGTSSSSGGGGVQVGDASPVCMPAHMADLQNKVLTTQPGSAARKDAASKLAHCSCDGALKTGDFIGIAKANACYAVWLDKYNKTPMAPVAQPLVAQISKIGVLNALQSQPSGVTKSASTYIQPPTQSKPNLLLIGGIVVAIGAIGYLGYKHYKK